MDLQPAAAAAAEAFQAQLDASSQPPEAEQSLDKDPLFHVVGIDPCVKYAVHYCTYAFVCM